MSPNDLPKFDEFRDAVEVLRNTSNTLKEFSNQLKKDPRLVRLRNAARNELQSIYEEARKDLELPRIPVFLPVRKKVLTRGQAHATGCTPTEIRVYPVEGPADIPYHSWHPKHLTVCTKMMVFEIFKHEIAHVISTQRDGQMDDHDEAFVTAYDEINGYFKSHGYDTLIDPALELWGVPSSSYAAQVAASRSTGLTRTQMTGSHGCLVLIAVTTIMVIVKLIA